MIKSKAGRLFLLGICFFSYVIYLMWRAMYTLPLDFGIVPIIAGILLLIAEIVGFFECVIFYITLWDTETPITPEVNNTEAFPDVDVFVATYNEPLNILYKTIIGCVNMDYPDKAKVHIYICDDGNRKELAEMCKHMDVNYITRTENTRAKAGNLNNALSKTSSPYVVTFDADMIPMHDFLMKTIPFFLQKENVGFVQVPQNFYNPDPFQYNLFAERNIPNEQALFFKMIQAGKNRFNAVIYAGSNTVISRQALAAAGGFIAGTITEDFATGMMIQSKGYKGIYLNESHAAGLSPETLEDIYNQRIRWGRGTVQTFKAYNPLRQPGLSLIQKLLYLSALSYWYFGIRRLIFLASPILYSVFDMVVLSASATSMLAIWLPMFILTNYIFNQFTKNIRNTSWSNIYETIMFPQVTIGVVLETIGLKMATFKVTPKDNVTRNRFVHKYKLVWMQTLLAVLTMVGMLKIIFLTLTTTFSANYLINFFWLSYNLYLLTMAVLCASERPKFRASERLLISTDVILYQDNKILRGITYDISETGLTILFDKPVYLDPHDMHKIKITTSRYSTEFMASIVHVTNYDGKYKYAFRIMQIDESDYQQLLLILYDREPLLPEKLTKDILHRNINNYIKNRQKKIKSMNRKYPRIPVNKCFVAYYDENRIVVHMRDFNFRFCAIRAEQQHQNLRIMLDQKEQFKMECVLEQELSANSNIGIYRITNYQELINNELVTDLLRAQSEQINKKLVVKSDAENRSTGNSETA